MQLLHRPNGHRFQSGSDLAPNAPDLPNLNPLEQGQPFIGRHGREVTNAAFSCQCLFRTTIGQLGQGLGDPIPTHTARPSQSAMRCRISAPYLSQRENGKIQQPSPTILNKLSEVYTYRQPLDD